MSDSVTVQAIPAFNDNYIWLLHNGKAAVVVDPGDSAPVIKALEALNLSLVAILNTHHHFDHIGGIVALQDRWGEAVVYGPISQALSQRACKDGDIIEPMSGLVLKVLEVPGHTLDHLAFFDLNTHKPRVFCGDTLFAGGCGRMFEGKPQQMNRSLQQLAALPAATLIYCAHEYTQANLRFALAVEPNNKQLQERVQAVAIKRQQDKSTVPSLMATELATNPFLRCNQSDVITAVEQTGIRSLESTDDVFAALRRWKDDF